MIDTNPTPEGIDALRKAHQKMKAFHDWLLDEPVMAVLEPIRRHDVLESLGNLRWPLEEQLYRALFKQPARPRQGDLWYHNDGDSGCQLGVWSVFVIGNWHVLQFASSGEWPPLPGDTTPIPSLDTVVAAALDDDEEAARLLFGAGR